MTAARYWRLVNFESYAGGDIEVSELQLWAGGSRVDASATVTCPLTPVSGSLSNATDNNLSTSVRYAVSSGLRITWDFGTSTTVEDMRVGAVTRDRFVAAVTVEYSSDGVTWARAKSLNRLTYPGDGVLSDPVDAVTPDPDFANVTLLVDGNTAVADKSNAARVLTVVGSVGISTSTKKYGAGSVSFPGLTSAYVTGSASSDFAFGTGDFTVEFWANKSSNGASGYDGAITAGTNDSAAGGWAVELSASRGFVLIRPGVVVASAATTVNDSTWHHWAVCRGSGTTRLFKDGTQIASTSDTHDYEASALTIGAWTTSGSYPFNGYIDDLRVTKGVARYTADFTPPADELPTDSSGGVGVEAPPYSTPLRQPLTVASEAIGTASAARKVGAVTNVRDTEFAGRGTITGTVKNKSDPTNVPVMRRVRLIRDRDGLVAGETWSDPVTGAYTFAEINENLTYTVLSYDHTGTYRAVVADKLIPTVA